MMRKSLLAARLAGDSNLAHHVRHGHHAPARRVPAFFRELLVFQLDRGRAGQLIAAHGVGHVQQAAITGVAIGYEGRASAMEAIARARWTMSVYVAMPASGSPKWLATVPNPVI